MTTSLSSEMGFFASGSHALTALRIAPVVLSSATLICAIHQHAIFSSFLTVYQSPQSSSKNNTDAKSKEDERPNTLVFREALNTYLQHSAFRVIYIMGTLYPLTLVSLLAAIFVNKEQMAGTNARAFYTSGLLFTIAHVVPAWVAGEFRKAIEGLDAAGAKIASKGKGESDSRDEQLAASMGKWVRLNQWRLLFVNLPAWGLIATATMACVTSK